MKKKNLLLFIWVINIQTLFFKGFFFNKNIIKKSGSFNTS